APETAAGDISGRCTDNAGNTSTYVHFLFKFDATGPSASLSASGLAGMNGWFIGNVTISAAGSDSVSDPTICTPDQHQTAETTGTAGQLLHGSCTNDAGLVANATDITVKRDATPPALTGSRTPLPNSYGWNNVDVTVNFSCSDATSGVNAGPLTPQVVSTEG